MKNERIFIFSFGGYIGRERKEAVRRGIVRWKPVVVALFGYCSRDRQSIVFYQRLRFLLAQIARSFVLPFFTDDWCVALFLCSSVRHTDEFIATDSMFADSLLTARILRLCLLGIVWKKPLIIFWKIFLKIQNQIFLIKNLENYPAGIIFS